MLGSITIIYYICNRSQNTIIYHLFNIVREKVKYVTHINVLSGMTMRWDILTAWLTLLFTCNQRINKQENRKHLFQNWISSPSANTNAVEWSITWYYYCLAVFSHWDTKVCKLLLHRIKHISWLTITFIYFAHVKLQFSYF